MEQDRNSIKWPGAWLEEELTQQESEDCVALARLISEIKKRGPFPKYPPNEKDPTVITPEYAAVWEKMAPYLNAFMHLVYKMDNLPPWTKKDPVGAVTSLIDFIFEDSEALTDLPGQDEETGSQMSLFPELEREQSIKGEILRALPHLQSTPPDKHIIPNNKLANSIVKDMIDAGSIILDVSSAKAKQSIDVICNLVYEGENVKLSGRQSFTEYDRNVYNAVTSLYVYGGKAHVVTPQTVYRAMVGMTDTEAPSPQQIGAVTKSLDKMRFIRATVDCTEELNRRNISLDGEYITNGIIDTYLLNASVIQVRAGGRTVRGYLIEKTPVLYAYSNALKEVLTIPAELLDIKAIDKKGRITKSRISNNESRIQVKGYLLRRIEGLKGKNALKNKTISLQSYEKGGEYHRGLYEIAGLSDRAARKDKKAVRDYAAQALDYWKASGYIKGFSFITAGKTITGIYIDP